MQLVVSLLALSFFVPACRRLYRVPLGLSLDAAGIPKVRVLLVEGAGQVRLGGGGDGLLLKDERSGQAIAALDPRQQWDAVRFGPQGELRLAMPDGRVSQPHPDGIRIECTGSSNTVQVNGSPYRGSVSVYSGPDGALRVINTLSIEQYLRSVVPSEMGSLDESFLEALKAQAVASRSFAVARAFRNQRFAYDLVATTGDQVYKGVSSETAAGDISVAETLGECLTYRGRVITAFYHSTCGGRTAEVEEVWGRDALGEADFLKSVKDGDYCADSPYYRWTVNWTRKDLLEQLKKILPQELGMASSEIGEPTGIEVVEKGPSGRNLILKVVTDKRILQLKGDHIRRVLRKGDGTLLPSTFFDLSLQNQSSGPVIVAQGRGLGHGLGMCQWGARGRAARGESYGSILKHYYKGIKLTKMY